MATGNRNSGRINLGVYSFDPETEELFRGGTRIPLQPQPARLMALFVSRPGQLIRREEIRDHIWPETTVDFETRISSAVRAIRSALSDDPGAPRFIETVQRKGYRYIGPVASEQDTMVKRRPPLMLAGLAAAALLLLSLFTVFDPGDENLANSSVPDRLVVAVLPVRDFQSDPDVGLPADILTDDLISGVARLAPNRLAEIARTTAMRFENSEQTSSEIAATLQADYIVETSVQSDGEVTRINANLVSALDDTTHWSGTYLVIGGDSQAMEAAFVEDLRLALALPESSPGKRLSTAQTTSPEAFSAYIQGRYMLSRGAEGDAEKALELFEQVRILDPEFAPANVSFALAAQRLGRGSDEVMDAIEAALRLDSGLAEAYFLRARLRFFNEWDWTGAGQDYETAIALDPGQAEFHASHALFLSTRGDYDRALTSLERAIQMDPLSTVVNNDLGFLYLRLGLPERALFHCNRLTELQPGTSAGLNCLISAYRMLGDLANAGEMALQDMAVQSADTELVANLRQLGGQQQLEGYWNWTINTQSASENPNHFLMAFAYVGLGDHEAAIAALQTTSTTRSFGMLLLGFDVHYDPIRDDPRFRALVALTGLEPREQSLN